MEYSNILSLIDSKKRGQFFSITWSKILPVKKNYEKYTIKKTSIAVVRIGVKYDNIRAVAEKRVSGELPSTNQGLPWGEWDIPGYTIKHKGKIYLRVSLVPGSKIKSEYHVDSFLATEDIARQMCLAKAFPNRKESIDVLTIDIENIERVV